MGALSPFIPLSLQTVLLPVASNVFMTFAWYGHLRSLATAPWYVAAFASRGIALAECLPQVPANRIGFQQAGFTIGQLRIMQEVITLAVFLPFPLYYLQVPLQRTSCGRPCAWCRGLFHIPQPRRVNSPRFPS